MMRMRNDMSISLPRWVIVILEEEAERHGVYVSSLVKEIVEAWAFPRSGRELPGNVNDSRLARLNFRLSRINQQILQLSEERESLLVNVRNEAKEDPFVGEDEGRDGPSERMQRYK